MKGIFYSLIAIIILAVLVVLSWFVQDYFAPDYIDGSIRKGMKP